MPVGNASLTYVDFDGQKGIFAFNTAVVTAANFAAISTAIDALKTATDEITDGLGLQKIMSQTTLLASSLSKSANSDSQRGNKWLVLYVDTTEEFSAGVPNPYYRKPFSVEVPTADFDLRLANNNRVFVNGDPANPTEWLTWVSAFEAVAKSPVGGAPNVQEIFAVTRTGG